MEFWRIAAGVLFGVGGLLLVPVIMAQSRDRRGATHVTVLLAGLISLVVLGTLEGLLLTLLPALAAWALVVLVVLTGIALLHAS